MRKFLAIFLGGLALAGTADARLGETIEEIEKRVGTLKMEEDRYNPDLLNGVATDKGGFSSIRFHFFKNDEKPIRCVGVVYSKFYKSLDDVALSPKDAGELLARNFPDPATAMQISESEGVSGDVATSRFWSVRWFGAKGEYATAKLYLDPDLEPVFSVVCFSARLFESEKRMVQKEREGAEERRRRAMDAL